MNNYNDNFKSIYNERGNASLFDNLKYINDTVSHLEINRFQGVGDIMYHPLGSTNKYTKPKYKHSLTQT